MDLEKTIVHVKLNCKYLEYLILYNQFFYRNMSLTNV